MLPGRSAVLPQHAGGGPVLLGGDLRRPCRPCGDGSAGERQPGRRMKFRPPRNTSKSLLDEKAAASDNNLCSLFTRAVILHLAAFIGDARLSPEVVMPLVRVLRRLAGFHAHRTSRRHRHYCHPHRFAAPGRAESARGRFALPSARTTSSRCAWPRSTPRTPTRGTFRRATACTPARSRRTTTPMPASSSTFCRISIRRAPTSRPCSKATRTAKTAATRRILPSGTS